MEYRVIFSASETGEQPIIEFLEELRERHVVLHNLVVVGLLKRKARDNHGPPRTAPIQGSPGMFELRVGRADIARVSFFFQPGQEIVCTNGYMKKAQKLDSREIARAKRYKAAWERRRPWSSGDG